MMSRGRVKSFETRKSHSQSISVTGNNFNLHSIMFFHPMRQTIVYNLPLTLPAVEFSQRSGPSGAPSIRAFHAINNRKKANSILYERPAPISCEERDEKSQGSIEEI